MMHPMWQALLLLVGATFIIWGLHALSWHLLHSLISVTDRLSGFRDSRVWARSRPLQAWLRLRHPQLHTIFAARLRTSSFSGLPLTLLIFSALYIAALLGGLTQEIMEAGTVLKLDLAINAFFTPWRERTLVRAFLWVTDLGSGPALTVVAMTATGFFWVDRRTAFILPLWIAFLGAQTTTWSGKYLIERHRPEFIQAVVENSPSFPSGHATASMALYGFLAYALVRDLPGRRERFEVVFWTAALIAAIGFSRVFLSVHYMTDVLAGFMVGAFWLLVGFAFAEWTRMHRSESSRGV